MVTFAEICEEIRDMLRDLKRVIVAIDGMCAAGKTTLAEQLSEVFSDTHVISMDDFYLPLSQRSDAVMAQPGGHMDLIRFSEEVAQPLWQAQSPSYGIFSCKSQNVIKREQVPENATLIIVEGTYATHPSIPDIYDYRIFVKIDEKTQSQRIEERNGALAQSYFTKWIPAESLYFSAYMTEALADAVYTTKISEKE